MCLHLLKARCQQHPQTISQLVQKEHILLDSYAIYLTGTYRVFLWASADENHSFMLLDLGAPESTEELQSMLEFCLLHCEE